MAEEVRHVAHSGDDDAAGRRQQGGDGGAGAIGAWTHGHEEDEGCQNGQIDTVKVTS